MNWEQAAPAFEWDGMWRDIYVRNAGHDGWRRVLDGLRDRVPAPEFTIAGEPAPTPERVEDIFALRAQSGPLMIVDLGGVRANCHFFGPDDIEFDLDPREITGPAQWRAVQAFMRDLGRFAGLQVSLTPENLPDAPFVIYRPDAGTFEAVGGAED